MKDHFEEFEELEEETFTPEGSEPVLMPDQKRLIGDINRLSEKRDVLSEEQQSVEAQLEEKLTASGLTEDQAASPIRNHEGAPAFLRSQQERTVQLLTTNTLSNTFYAKQEEINQETTEVLEEMAKSDPEFLAQALVYAREEGLLQLAPTLGLAVLSKAEDKRWFRKAFPRIISTPDNLRAFVKICKSGTVREGFGGVATEAAKEWLGNLSEYQAVKYSGDARSKRGKDGSLENNFSLRDLIVLARPKPETPEMAERYRWLVRGTKGEDIENNPKIKAYEMLKAAQTDEERAALIKEGGLPWEVVIPAVPEMTPTLWEALMGQMPYMALLRNINNLRKHRVLDSDENVEHLVARLTDPKAIQKARILPFRFFEAYQAYTGDIRIDNRPGSYWERKLQPTHEQEVDSRITDSLEEALEASFVNMPELDGDIAIASDVSGSMEAKINDRGHTRYIDICGVFTGALLKKAADRVHSLPFDTEVRRADLSGQDRILSSAKKIADMCGGGTALGAPIERLLKTGKSVDTFIGITDNEEWAYGSRYTTNGSFLKSWRKYRDTVNPDAEAYLIRIDPYKDAVAPENEPGVHFIYGWSDAVLNYIAKDRSSKDSQIEEVKAIEL